MGKSKIKWTDMVWNPITGCSHMSEGCRNCYAEAMDRRWHPTRFRPWTAENAEHNVTYHEDRLRLPLHWKKPRKVFVNSMSDLFHNAVATYWIVNVFAVMAAAQDHAFQVLTKRPQRMKDLLTSDIFPVRVEELTDQITHTGFDWPLPNVWLGVSAEDQGAADTRIPLLLDTPAAIRWVSVEPMLEAVDIETYMDGSYSNDNADPNPNAPTLDWVVCGGESGPGFRRMDLDWVQSLRDQCEMQDVPFFFKQRSGRYPGQNDTLDGVTYHEFPKEGK